MRQLVVVLAVGLVVAVPVALGSLSVRDGRIVFVAVRATSASGIVSIGVQGHGRRLLTHSNDSGPVVSPDGKQVAFTCTLRSGSAVFVMNADGSGQRRVGSGLGPTWSPDGRHLAYLASTPSPIGPGSSVVVVDLATGRSTVIWPNVDLLPVWSPDGSHIDGIGSSDSLMVMQADGTDRRQLVETVTSFSWSPDGKRIAYGLYDGRLRVVSVDGATRDTIVRGGLVSASNVLWSPDGKSIVFTGAQQQAASAPRVVSLANRVVRTVGTSQDEPVAWSPDSKSLALLRTRPNSTAQQIVIASADGRSSRQVTHEDPNSTITNGRLGPSLAWSRTNTLFFEHVGGARFQLISVDPPAPTSAGSRTTTPATPIPPGHRTAVRSPSPDNSASTITRSSSWTATAATSAN